MDKRDMGILKLPIFELRPSADNHGGTVSTDWPAAMKILPLLQIFT